MSLEAEVLIDRRRMRRRVTFWRAIAFVIAVIAIIGLISSTSNMAPDFARGSHVARIPIKGIITENRKQLALFESIADDKNVRAVLLDVNSPGGTTTGGEALFEAIRRVSEKKPVVAVFGTVAASAAYIVGLASDHIVARGNSITGSVGVIFQWTEVHELLGKVGVKMNTVKSGPLKASPSPFQPLDEASRLVTEEMVMDSQTWFLGLVKERRKLLPATVPGLVEGRIYSGRQALNYKLVDAIGGEREALKWLESKHGIKADTKVIERKPATTPGLGILGKAMLGILGVGASEFGKSGLIRALDGKLSGLSLDGLLSVWHPSKK